MAGNDGEKRWEQDMLQPRFKQKHCTIRGRTDGLTACSSSDVVLVILRPCLDSMFPKIPETLKSFSCC